MRRRTLLSFLATAPFAAGTSAFAQTAIASAPLSYDSAGRPQAPVSVNGQTPIDLVIDTAAGGTVLGAAAIERLHLTPSGRARMQGASGAVDTDLYTLDSVALDTLVRTNQQCTRMPDNSASGHAHAGVLGMPTFSGARISFDFANNRFSADPNESRTALARTTPVTFRHGVFAFTQASIGGVEVSALIDTGARRTIGNGALRAALGFTENDARLSPTEPIGGATAHRTEALATPVDNIRAADHDYGAFELAFADLPVFRGLQLSDAPGLILGIDILRRAQRLTLDYSSREMALIA